MASNEELTTGEAQLYDRQLRLWGIDAQRRLKTSRVFMFGLSALTGEVAKNLILAGVNRVTLVENRKVTESDFDSSFFTSQQDVGRNLAEVFCENLKVLNSLVKVDWFDWQFDSESTDLAHFFEKYEAAQPSIQNNDVVLISGFNLNSSATLAQYCRDKGASVYVSGCKGALGCFFADLGDSFKFVQSDDAQLSNFQRSNVGAEQNMCFPSLHSILGLNPSLKRSDVVKTDSPLGQRYFSLACSLLNVISEGKGLDSIDSAVLEICGDNLGIISNPKLTPATSSVVGGILGQEIVKVICRNAAPFNNFFFIDVTRFFSLVDCIRKADKQSVECGSPVAKVSQQPVAVSP